MLRILDVFDLGGKSIVSNPLFNALLSIPVHVCHGVLFAAYSRRVAEARHFPCNPHLIESSLGSFLSVLYWYCFPFGFR